MTIGCSQASVTFCRKKSSSNLQPTALSVRRHGFQRKSLHHGKNKTELFVFQALAEKNKYIPCHLQIKYYFSFFPH